MIDDLRGFMASAHVGSSEVFAAHEPGALPHPNLNLNPNRNRMRGTKITIRIRITRRFKGAKRDKNSGRSLHEPKQMANEQWPGSLCPRHSRFTSPVAQGDQWRLSAAPKGQPHTSPGQRPG